MRSALVIIGAVLSIGVLAAPAPMPSPTGIPSASTAKSKLAGLKVAERGSTTGYSRDKFKHWLPVNGTDGCDTRDVVLQRDGTDVKTGSSCKIESGTWVSPYDGGKWTQTSDVDIDHMVPLENAWVSGAADWTDTQRSALANDLTRPQLWAVTDNVNQSKGDRAPDEWKPPSQDFYCTYAEAWVTVKDYYKLIVTQDEKDQLSSMLDTC